MRCKQGDLAIILKSVFLPNVGKCVTVAQYAGMQSADEKFHYGDFAGKLPISDHYWWVTSPYGLESKLGPISKAIVPDSWLHPIRPLPGDEEDKETLSGSLDQELLSQDVHQG